MTDSQKLLAEYATSGSNAAFRDLVTRYLNLVYSTAVRLLDGDTCLAEDVTQSVFIDLARAAPSLPKGVMVGGWLHRHTRYIGSKTLRGERRRHLRSNSHYGKQRGADLLVCRLQGPLAPRGVGDSINRQVGDLPHSSPK